MALLGANTYEITELGSVDYSDTGYGVNDDPVVFNAELTIQQAKGNELSLMRDYELKGKDLKGAIRIYSESDNLKIGSSFVFDNEKYEIVKRLPRREIIPHYKYFAIMVNEGT